MRAACRPVPATPDPSAVIPAQAGIQHGVSSKRGGRLDSRLRGNNTAPLRQTFQSLASPRRRGVV